MSENFGAITVLDEKCQKCPKVGTCNHKRMAHLEYIIPTRASGKLDFQKRYFEEIMKERYL